MVKRDTGAVAPERPRDARPDASGNAPTTRERILDVALDLFARKGYAETSLREIAAELGLSKAALYYHFESKQDILAALHLRLHHLTDGLEPLLRAEAASGDTWDRLIDQLIGLVLENRRLVELNLRNQQALTELHRDGARSKHGSITPPSDLEPRFMALLRDPSASLEERVRRTASLGTIAGVMFAAGSFSDVPDAELEAALRNVVHDLLGREARARPHGD
jgi:AcrR family transcriptional regulator